MGVVKHNKKMGFGDTFANYYIGFGVILFVVAGSMYFYYAHIFPMVNTSLQLGTLVRYKMKACPAAISVAAFGASGTESHYQDPQSCKYCEDYHPTWSYTSSGGSSSWIISAGLEWISANENGQCWNIKPGGIPNLTCSVDADCFSTITSQTYHCIQNQCVVATSQNCPPPRPCSLQGQEYSIGNTIVNSCKTVPAEPTDPCTGCYAGQTCQGGYCSGLAKHFIAVPGDFIVEGSVSLLDQSKGLAYINWERIRNVTPVHFASNPNYYQGCIVVRQLCDSSMSSLLFGSAYSNNGPLVAQTILEKYGAASIANPQQIWPLSVMIDLKQPLGSAYSIIPSYSIPRSV